MKCFWLLVLVAAASAGADFKTGQAARLVIGQTNFTQQDDGASDTLLGGLSGVAYANNMLFVADSSRSGAVPVNNRVLIYKDLSTFLPGPTDELFYTQPCPVCVGQANVVLGQPDFSKTDPGTGNSGMRLPTAVASDGKILLVADTDNNRILIWNTIPTANGQPADVVIGQPDFKSSATAVPPNNKSMRGPQGVWLQFGRLYVADTQNHRVLIYNSVPSSNGAAADIVLGQPDFNTFVEPDLTQQKGDAKATNLLNPVSVTSDGQRLYVTDLGYNRVLIWNTIPTKNQTPADVAIGQPDLTSSLANNSFTTDSNSNNSKVLCDSNGADSNSKPTFPGRCNATLSFPRFALSDGTRLFVADGGNDRILLFNSIPTQNAASADYIIGEIGGDINQASDAADSLRAPMSLAWDGTNLYVGDSYNRRVMIYSGAEPSIPYTGVRNAASRQIYAVGSVTLGGTIKENDEFTLTISGKDYKYKILKDDTLEKVVTALVNLINAPPGDPNVFASPDLVTVAVILTARQPGDAGNSLAYSVTTSTSATITGTTAGATLAGGQDAAKIGPGTLVSIVGDSLSDDSGSVPADAQLLPTELAGTQVYFNGIRAPLTYVSPGQINAQIPFELNETTSINAYVRTKRRDGSVTVTDPVAVTIVPQNPGIFAEDGADPRVGILLHGSSNATGTVSVDGTVKAGDTASVTIEDRTYTYTVQDGDSLAGIRDALVTLINQDPQVQAYAAGVFTRIRLKARVPGPDGNGIVYSAKGNDGGQVILTATGSALCCANVGGSRVTPDNPALPGETIIVYATGLGLPILDDNVRDHVKTGIAYDGPDNQPVEFVSSLAGGKTANVLSAGLKPGTVGIYEVQLELNSDIPTNPFTQVTIAQDVYVSNIVTFPVFNPNPPGTP